MAQQVPEQTPATRATLASAPAQSEAAARYQALITLIGVLAAAEAVKAAGNPAKAALAILRYQIMAATLAGPGIAQMLAAQGGPQPKPVAQLSPPAFTTELNRIEQMLDTTQVQWEIERLAKSLVQEAARAAEQTAITVRENVSWVRQLRLPSCSRCAILAGRVYRYSDGFQRHPGCDCVHLPVTTTSPENTYDPDELVRTGQVTDLSKADREAVEAGADLSQVVNVRRKAAGLTDAGVVLERAGRPTPAAIFAQATSRADAIELLSRYGYLT